MLQEVFAEVGDIANRIAEDRKVLNQVAQQHARMIETSANESYSAGFYGCLWPLGILFILGTYWGLCLKTVSGWRKRRQIGLARSLTTTRNLADLFVTALFRKQRGAQTVLLTNAVFGNNSVLTHSI